MDTGAITSSQAPTAFAIDISDVPHRCSGAPIFLRLELIPMDSSPLLRGGLSPGAPYGFLAVFNIPGPVPVTLFFGDRP
jgi:hypothetical protein